MRASIRVALGILLVASFGCGGSRDKRADSALPDKKTDGKATHSDVEKIKGTWRIMSLSSHGTQEPAKNLEKARVVITAATLSIRTGLDDEPDEPIKYHLDPLQEPRAIDLFIKEESAGKGDKALEKTHVSPGIYHLDGNNLKICWSMERQLKKNIDGGTDDGAVPQRPRAFVEGRDTILLILKRE